MAITYRTRSVTVLAYQWITPDAPDWVREHATGTDPDIRFADDLGLCLTVRTWVGEKPCLRGDWIIRMPQGGLDVCSAEAFPLFFEEVY